MIEPRALGSIVAERMKQNAKWGEQNHDDKTWALIAGEEFGEVQQAILHDEFGGEHAGTVREECVQLAAVMLAWIDAIDRRSAKKQENKAK